MMSQQVSDVVALG